MEPAADRPAPAAAGVFPADAVMSSLLALATGAGMLINPTTGAMAVYWEDGRGVLVPAEHLDELFARGWIAADDEAKVVTTTERGGYWLNRWADAQARKMRRDRRST